MAVSRETRLAGTCASIVKPAFVLFLILAIPIMQRILPQHAHGLAKPTRCPQDVPPPLQALCASVCSCIRASRGVFLFFVLLTFDACHQPH